MLVRRIYQGYKLYIITQIESYERCDIGVRCSIIKGNAE